MKTQKGIREHDADELRKAKRLEPIRKSGKERHALYSSFDEEDEEEILPLKRESVLDYLDEEDPAAQYRVLPIMYCNRSSGTTWTTLPKSICTTRPSTSTNL